MSGSSVTPQTAPPRLCFRVPPEPSHLLRARERLRDYLRQYCTEDELIDDVVLCVEEAATNAIRHSGSGDDIEISLQFAAQRLEAQVRDHGRGFDVASFDPQRHPDPTSDHGRGLFVIAALMDSFELRVDGGLEVRIARRAEPRCDPTPLDSVSGEPQRGDHSVHRDVRTGAMLEEIDEGFVALDWEYRYVHANQASVGITHRSLEELLGHTPWELFPEPQGAPLWEHFREAMELGIPSVSEYHAIPSGEWLEVRIYPTVSGVSAYFHNITERKRKEEDLERLIDREKLRARRTSILKDVAEAAAAMRESTDPVQRLVERCRTSLGASHVSVAVADEGSGRFTLLAHGPGSLESAEHLREVRLDSDTESARAYRSGRARLLADHVSVDALDATSALERSLGVRSSAVLPLLIDQKAVGVLAVGWPEPHGFDADEVQFLESLAAAVALGLQNVRLHEAEAEAQRQTRRELATTSLLLEAVTAATSWTGLDALLESLGDLLLRSTDHSRVLLELWDVERQEVEVAVSMGSAAIPRQRFKFEAISDGARQVITTKRTAVIDYTQTGLPRPHKEYIDEHDFLLMLVVPIVYRERLVGLITVDQPGEARPFSPREIELVEAIASQTGAAIENARLVERETAAARFEKSLAWSRTTGLVRRLRTHPWRVLAGSIAIESVILWSLGSVGNERRVLGLPGSMIALIAVIAGALAGPLVGALVALAGGVVFYVTVADYGSRSSLATTAISTAIWLVAGLVAGLLAKGLREQTERRRTAAVALARADAAREAQLAEQARIEELATGLQAQTDALAERADLAEALNAVNTVIHSVREFDDIMQSALARGAAALNVDAGTIEQWEEESWVVAYQHGFSAAEVGLRQSVAQAPIASRVRATARPIAVGDLQAEPQLATGFPFAHGLRSALAVPLVVREEVTGCLLFYGRKARAFSEAEVDFARQLGVTVSLAVDNARLYLDQRRIAQTLQENLIHQLPTVPGVELGVVANTANQPELVGGDFSDAFVLDDRQVVVLIGDVAGKGVRAAGQTETVRSTMRALAAIDSSPASVLAKTNELFLRFDPDRPHVTALVAALDLQSGHLSYASAGHPAPVYLGEFSCRELDVTFGPPLGSFERPYSNAHTILSLEDYLVLYTDGVTEARRDGELFGEQRLLKVVTGLRGQSAREVAEGVRDAAMAFAGTLRDDLQVVVLRLA